MKLRILLLSALFALASVAAQAQTNVIGRGVIYSLSASSGTSSGTSEQTLASYSLPGGALQNVGDRIRISGSFVAAANGNNKTYKVYFGSESISSGTQTNNGTGVPFTMDVSKTGSSTQTVTATMSVGTSLIAPVETWGTETDTAPITIKATGTDGSASAGDIAIMDLKVEKLR